LSGYALLWSGGKDSSLALRRALLSGLEVRRLLNFHDATSGRVRFHATRVELLQAQADALGIQLSSVGTTWEGMEAELRNELSKLAAEDFSGVVLGDIHLADVRAWYEDRVLAAGLKHVEPLWAEPPAGLLQEFVAGGGRAVVTCVDLERLDESWLGRVIDPEFVSDLAETGIDACGENGEYHSFAFAGPPFRRTLGWRAGERRTEGRFAQLDVLAGDPGGVPDGEQPNNRSG
jgi:diphthine-ammonia ligase